MSPRPLDLLEATIGEIVTVRLKGGDAYAGSLGGYDQHLNVVLEPTDEIDANADDGPAMEGTAGPAAEPIDTTTIIRGDNVVSVTT